MGLRGRCPAASPANSVSRQGLPPGGIHTGRLLLREMDEADLPHLAEILQDPLAMAAYNGPLPDAEVARWLENQQRRYREEGIGLWAAVSLASGEMLGQVGLTRQELRGTSVCEVGYLFKRRFWHHDYATEAAVACRDYAFAALGESLVYSFIRVGNHPSIAVARRNGMRLCGTLSRHWRGEDIPHLVYCVENGRVGTTWGNTI